MPWDSVDKWRDEDSLPYYESDTLPEGMSVLEVPAVQYPPSLISVGDIVSGAYGYSVEVVRILDSCDIDGARLLVRERR